MPINWTEHKPADADGTRWKPTTIGDKLSGKITAARTITSQYGEAPLLEVDDGETVWEYIVGQTDALRKCAELEPAVGDLITLEYVNDVTLKNGHVMKEFAVSVNRGAGGTVAADDLF